MNKAIFAGGVIAALIARALSTRHASTRRIEIGLNFQGAFLPLVGPGSSIGVTVRDADSGVVVQEVRADSPASRAGVKEGDVVTEFDGERARSAAQFTRLVRETAPGQNGKDGGSPERDADDDGHCARDQRFG